VCKVLFDTPSKAYRIWLGKVCSDKFGYQFNCKKCKEPFTICVSCYRGNKYCGAQCSAAARRKSQTKSNRKNAILSKSKKLHRKRQNRYRKKILATKKVTEHSSQRSPRDLKSLCRSFDDHQPRRNRQRNQNQCIVCKSYVPGFISLEDAYLRRIRGYRPRI